MATIGNSPRSAAWPAACVALALLAGCNEREADTAGSAAPPVDAEASTAAALPAATAPRTSGVAPASAVVVAPMPPPPTEADNTEIPVDVIVVTPAPHLGQAVVGTAKVAEVPFDRGFWIEKNGQRMFAVIAQSPDMEQAINIDPGQNVRLAGVIYDSALASAIAGQMDPKAMETIAKQPAFLLVDARNISIIDPTASNSPE